ncbi:MAG: hypothetical protein ACE5GW_12330, partial [Planctomycetota bacterium]
MIELRDRAVAAKAEELALSDMEWGKNQEREGNAALDDGRFELAYRHFESAKGAFAGAIERAKGAVVTSAIPMPSAGQSYPGGLDGGDSREAAPEVGEIDIPDLGDDSDPDLETGILKLFHVTPEYSNGILRLSYPLGADLKHDLIHVQGSEQDIIFEGADWVGFGQNDYSFAGNTFGYWLMNASFEDGVRVRCKVLFQLTLDLNPYFNVVFM